VAEEEPREENKQEGGCPPCVDGFINEICNLLPEPHSGKCRQLVQDLVDGKITTEQFAAEGWRIPGLPEAFKNFSQTKKEE